MESVLKIMSKDPVSTKLEQINFNIVSIGYLDNPDSRTSPISILQNYKALILIGGDANVYFGDEVHYMNEGDCVLIAPGTLYKATFTQDKGTLFAINFDFNSIIEAKLFEEMVNLNDLSIYQRLLSKGVIELIYKLFEDAINEVPGAYFRIQLMLKRLISSITFNNFSIIENCQKQGNSSEEKTVLKCHDYLMNNPSAKVSVDDLCAICDVSQSYLYKCFKNILGISTKNYITQVKISIAKKNLVQTNKSISTIAYETGFNNAYHFSNVFKDITGISPSMYRKNNK